MIKRELALRLESALRVRVTESASAIHGLARMASGRRVLPCFGVIGERNIGDELLCDIARDRLASKLPAFVCHRSPLRSALLQACLARGSDLLVGGGTLLLSEPAREVLESYVTAGGRIATFGTGVQDPLFWGPLDEHQAASWVRILGRSTILGVRGPRSKEILDALAVTEPVVVGDPAVLLTQPSPSPVVKHRILGVNFGTALGRIWGGDEEAAHRAICEALVRLRTDGWAVRFFCVWPRDYPAVRRLARGAGYREGDIVAEYSDPLRFMREVSTCRLFVGMKLHSVILAICTGVASLALEYQPKTSDFMLAVGAAGEVIRLDNADGEQLAERVLSASAQAPLIAARQWEGSRKLAATFRRYLSSLDDLL